jgi:hypothetical protein
MKQFFKRIKNLIRWFPIIWKDQDWDDWYIFEILKFKLKNQAEYIGYHDRHRSAKRDAEIMMLCVRLIDKIQNEYYAEECMDYHESDYNWIESKTHPDYYELDIVLKSERFDEYFKKYPLIYKQVLSSDKNIFKINTKQGIAMNMGHINEKRAHKLLFKILEQNITRWWD